MNTDEKNCPFCGETIKAIAIKCKHCQSDLITPVAKETVETKSSNEDINCRYCGEVNVGTAITCKKCKLELNNTLTTDAPIKYSFKEAVKNDFKKNGKKTSLLLVFACTLFSLSYFDIYARIYSYYFDPQTVNSKQTDSSQSEVQTAKTTPQNTVSKIKFRPIQFKCAFKFYGTETLTYYKVYQTRIDMEIWNALDKNNALLQVSLNRDLIQNEGNLYVYILDDMTLKYDIINNLLWDYSAKNPFQIGSDSNSCKTSFYFDPQTVNSKQTVTDIKSNPNLKTESNGNILTPKLTTVKYSCAGGVFNFIISNEKVTMDFVTDYFKFFDIEIGHRGQDVFVYKSTINNEGLTYDPALEIISLIKFNGSNVVDATIVKDCVKN